MSQFNKKNDSLYYVEIVHNTEQVVKRMGPFPYRYAEKVENGANTNLNHEHYYTQIVSAREEER